MVQHSARKASRRSAVLCAALVGLLNSGCAQHDGKAPDLFLSSSESEPTPKAAAAADAALAGKPYDEKDLAEVTGFWGKRYSEAPSDLKTALTYAKHLKAMGQKQQALAVLQQASVFHGDNRELAGEYGRLALDLGQIGVAEKLLAFADDPTNPDWRVISARGTALAKQGKYTDAIPYYERALTLAHDHPSLLNNLAMAHAMLGDAKKAEGLLRQAALSETSKAKVRQNLALVLGLQGKYQESTSVAARDMPATVAAADAQYLRKLTKLSQAEAPQAEPARQVAGGQAARGQLKGTTTGEDTALGGWDSEVAAASAR